MARIPSPDSLPVHAFVDQAAFETWLEAHHADSTGVWLAIAKKGSGAESVTYAEAIDAALCFGWIDGQKRAHDEHWFLQRFTPRRPRSPWSKINREKVESLAQDGRIRPPGQREIDRAKEDGRWEAAYAGSRTISVPDDLQAELDADPEAAAFFETLNSQNRYSILYRIDEAKKPETRARRITKFMQMLRDGETVHPQ